MIGDPEARGQGLAKEATQLLLAAAFDQFRLNEIYLEVFHDNAPAIAIYRQFGFQPYDQQDNLLLMRLIKFDEWRVVHCFSPTGSKKDRECPSGRCP
jgi:RimJ/RimL family protein N-acetyltransferase